MQIKVPPSTHSDLLETREQRLTGFVTAGIEDVGGLREGSILAIARCGESPVARALMALRPTLVAAGIKTRIIFAEEDALFDQFMADSAEGNADGSGVPEVRIARNPRLRDAHEQLIVCGASVWFGDSLRRDLNRRDLFEQFLAATPDAAVAAARAFEKLWLRTEPYLTLAALSSDSMTALPGRKPGNAGPTGPALR